MNQAPEQLVGRTLGGRYRLDRSIGVGGMGAVFQATQLDLGRAVAVKVLLDVDERAIARLRQEALAAGALSCPYVVSIFDFQAPPGEPPFIVMELLAGESLAQLLAREGRLAVDRACRIAVEALVGLDFAHRAGVTHRDIKPSNLWLSSGRGMEGHVKVLDFGIAKLVDDRDGVRTTTGSLLGTPAYLSPEQLRGHPADERSDQHAIAVVLFEMLTGARPWQSQGVALYAEILERVPPSVEQLAPHVPRELAAVIARGLAKDPAARFASADEMRMYIAPFARGGDASRSLLPPSMPPWQPAAAAATPAPHATPAHAPLPPPAPSKSSAWVFVLFAALVLVPGALAGAYFAGQHVAGAAGDPNAADASGIKATPSVTTTSSGSSTSAQPVTPGPTPTPSAARQPPPVTASKTKPKCECIDARGSLLCQRPMIAQCNCEAPGGFSLCPVKRDAADSCPAGAGRNRTGATLKHGDACTGFNGDGKNTVLQGKLDCLICYGHPKEPAVPNTPCQGIRQAASTPDERGTGGLWVCD
ncbi:MAG: serine/threonine protein kinase [Deltaproteobacteria bacterium]|nr:serine/threonine protein kinase [Deltaproteobacteria bacterium]